LLTQSSDFFGSHRLIVLNARTEKRLHFDRKSSVVQHKR
jgi:hypothetical protein